VADRDQRDFVDAFKGGRYHAWLACLAILVSIAIAGDELDLRRLLVFLVCFGLLELIAKPVASVVIGPWMRRLEREAQDYERPLRSLSVPEARGAALLGLERGRAIEVIPRSQDQGRTWPAAVRELLDPYREIRLDCGSFLSVSEVAPATEQLEDWSQIGVTFDGARVLVRSRDGFVSELDEGEVWAREHGGYPSVEHWLASRLNMIPGLEDYEPPDKAGR